jgi:peroxiredoxin
MLASLLVLVGCGPETSQPQAGEAAPSFQVVRLDGSRAMFPQDYRGRVVALRFWADTCPFCRKEMSAIESVYERDRADGLAILAMNVGQSAQVAERFTSSLGISYEVGLDEDAVVARRYGVTGLPMTYFIDRQGKVRSKILGESNTDTFEGVAGPLLGEPPP